MRAEIGDDELRPIGSQSQASQADVRRQTAGRQEPSAKGVLLETENFDVIKVGDIDLLARLIVQQKPEKAGQRIRSDTLQILE